MNINKQDWPWSTTGLAMCSCGWKSYSALLAYARSQQENFEVISCIPPGTPESHMERWARSDAVPVHHMKASEANLYVRENKKILGLSISVADYENKEIIDCMKKFYLVNILAGKREHKLNIEICKKLTKNKFHWGLDDSHHGTEIFCSKRGLN